MALRPLTVLSAAYLAHLEVNDGNQTSEASCVCAAESFVAHILTIPFLVQHISPSLVPALQHPSALAPCLWSFGVSMSGPMKAATSSHTQMSEVKQELEIFPPSLWALANMVSLASGSSPANLEGKEIVGPFGKGLDFEDYVHALCCLLSDLRP
ncbi:hypothetical protein MPTK2_Ug00170 [Marchantia polymorpha subsp. ruderalis]